MSSKLMLIARFDATESSPEDIGRALETFAPEAYHFDVIVEPSNDEEAPNPSEPYRSMISSSLYSELVEEQELVIIAEPYVIDENYDLTLIPVKSEDYLDAQFALCDYKELKLLLGTQDIEKFKAFDITPYKQGSDDGQL